MKRMILPLALLLLVAFLVTGCGKKENVLYVFNWTDYLDPDLVSQFEEENNCKIRLSTYDSNENMLIKVKSSRESFDLVFPSGDHVDIMAESGLLEELDKTKLSNYANLDPALLKKSLGFDPENKYSIPYFWGLTGLIYNKDFISEDLIQSQSWDILANDFFTDKNKLTMLDDAREVVGAALIYSGYSVNDTSDEAIAAASNVLSVWDQHITQFDSDSYKNEVQDGTTWLAQAYNGDALQLMAENEKLGFFLPTEGSCLWMDNVVMLKSSKNKELAYKFMNFLMDAEVAAKNAEYCQYASPNKAAREMLDEEIISNPLIYPSDEYLDKCYMIEPLGEAIKKIDAVYEKIKMI